MGSVLYSLMEQKFDIKKALQFEVLFMFFTILN